MKKRINKILHTLNDNLYEREEVIQLALLATLSGESLFLLGPPGVAKSLLSRRLKHIFKEGKAFEYLMNRFSTPDEIFGPISIAKLKNEDKYERLTEAYLPESDIVFLDEIWKAGPSIQNTLLTVVNEKIYRNGKQEIKIPLKGLLSASNELPVKGEGLDALWDRFILRYLVTNISEGNNFNSFLKGNRSTTVFSLKEELKISNNEFNEWQTNINKVKISDEALNVINVIRNYIADYNNKIKNETPIYVSDRRWLKIVKILKTSAFLNERKEIDLMDCFLIVHTIWDVVEQIPTIREFVSDAIKNHGYTLKYNLKSFSNEIEDLKLDIKNQSKKEKKVSLYVPKSITINNNFYYEINSNSDLKDGYYRVVNFILKKDFEKLSKTTYNKVKLFDKDGKPNSSVEFEAFSKSPNEIFIREKRRNSWESVYKGRKYELIKSRSSKIEIETSRPHNAIIDVWDKKIEKISKQTIKVIDDIKSYQKTELKGLKENIFVNKQFASIPESNLETTITHLLDYKKEVEQLKKEYDKLT